MTCQLGGGGGGWDQLGGGGWGHGVWMVGYGLPNILNQVNESSCNIVSLIRMEIIAGDL